LNRGGNVFVDHFNDYESINLTDDHVLNPANPAMATPSGHVERGVNLRHWRAGKRSMPPL
jgi:hypothetical protein